MEATTEMHRKQLPPSESWTPPDPQSSLHQMFPYQTKMPDASRLPSLTHNPLDSFRGCSFIIQLDPTSIQNFGVDGFQVGLWVMTKVTTSNQLALRAKAWWSVAPPWKQKRKETNKWGTHTGFLECCWIPKGSISTRDLSYSPTGCQEDSAAIAFDSTNIYGHLLPTQM